MTSVPQLDIPSSEDKLDALVEEAEMRGFVLSPHSAPEEQTIEEAVHVNTARRRRAASAKQSGRVRQLRRAVSEPQRSDEIPPVLYYAMPVPPAAPQIAHSRGTSEDYSLLEMVRQTLAHLEPMTNARTFAQSAARRQQGRSDAPRTLQRSLIGILQTPIPTEAPPSPLKRTRGRLRSKSGPPYRCGGSAGLKPLSSSSSSMLSNESGQPRRSPMSHHSVKERHREPDPCEYWAQVARMALEQLAHTLTTPLVSPRYSSMMPVPMQMPRYYAPAPPPAPPTTATSPIPSDTSSTTSSPRLRVPARRAFEHRRASSGPDEQHRFVPPHLPRSTIIVPPPGPASSTPANIAPSSPRRAYPPIRRISGSSKPSLPRIPPAPQHAPAPASTPQQDLLDNISEIEDELAVLRARVQRHAGGPPVHHTSPPSRRQAYVRHPMPAPEPLESLAGENRADSPMFLPHFPLMPYVPYAYYYAHPIAGHGEWAFSDEQQSTHSDDIDEEQYQHDLGLRSLPLSDRVPKRSAFTPSTHSAFSPMNHYPS